MTLNELSQKLKDMYTDANKGEQVTMIYVFGITYHEQIKREGVKQVIEQSGIRSSYHSELSKAIKLAKFVTVK